MPDITLVIVNYHSAELTRGAIASARQTTSASLRVIVVDNSCDTAESRRLDSVGADDVIISPDNCGYSGGANRGSGAATSPIVVVSNPDVVFGASCIDRLSELVRAGAAVAGPAFHWDVEGEWLLPPAEVLGVREKFSQVVASRSRSAARLRNRERTRRRIAFWRNVSPVSVEAVSGAVMAIDREKLVAVGGFDEGYELYFEEIDLARRLRGRGWEIRYDPSARCRHMYNQSAALDPESGAKFLRSESTYLRRWARPARPLASLVRVASAPDESAFGELVPSEPVTLPLPEKEWLVEASPLLSFDSAVGRFASGREIPFPAEIWSSYRSPTLYLRVVDPESLETVRQHVMRK